MKHDSLVNLDLMKMKFPITAIVSILHRVSAVVVWGGLGLGLCLLCKATSSEQEYLDLIGSYNECKIMKFVSWGFLSVLVFYCLATVKHLLQDFGLFEELESGKKISWVTLLISVAVSLVLGVMIHTLIFKMI